MIAGCHTSKFGELPRLQQQIGVGLELLEADPMQDEVDGETRHALDWVAEWRGEQATRRAEMSRDWAIYPCLDAQGCLPAQVVVEGDGPGRLCGRRPSGATRLKHRQLRLLGTTLVSVPQWRWDELPGEEARVSYLRDTLDRAVAS